MEEQCKEEVGRRGDSRGGRREEEEKQEKKHTQEVIRSKIVHGDYMQQCRGKQ
ncbi:unnamed protein product [Musa textilis]